MSEHRRPVGHEQLEHRPSRSESDWLVDEEDPQVLSHASIRKLEFDKELQF